MQSNKTYNPILVTGIERSGCSIIARIVELAGAYTGELSRTWEHKQIKQMMDSYFIDIKADPAGQFPLINPTNVHIPVTWALNIARTLEKEGYLQNKPWMYKSNRILQNWKVWQFAFPEAKWVIVRRKTSDIIDSCQKTGYMKAFKSPAVLQELELFSEYDGWHWWIQQQEEMMQVLINSGVNYKVIWPDRMVNGDYKQIYEMLIWLGLKWNDRIIGKINPLLNKSRRKEQVCQEQQ